MRTSTPPSYDKIFQMYSGTGTLSASVVSQHRGLFLINTDASINLNVTATNIDGTTCTLPIPVGATVLPLQIWKLTISAQQSNIKIYGLL